MSVQGVTAAASVRTVAVFCGSRLGDNPAYRQAADRLGSALAQAGLRLVYGGGSFGSMGVLADAALRAGGEVVGVIPAFLELQELAHRGLTQLIRVDSMHARKALMIEKADLIVALPGGFGTLDELVEAITWRILRLHDKPIWICNIAGWADGILGAFDRAVADGFADPRVRQAYALAPDIDSLIGALQAS